jgi:hypothetical protein
VVDVVVVEVVVTPSGSVVVVVVAAAAAPAAMALIIAEITDAGGRGGVTPFGTNATEICTLVLSGTELAFVVRMGFADSRVGQYAISTYPGLPASLVCRPHFSPFLKTRTCEFFALVAGSCSDDDVRASSGYALVNWLSVGDPVVLDWSTPPVRAL